MKTILVRSGQTIFDIALQYYGDIEGLKYLLEDNDGLDLSVPLLPKQKIQIRNSIINKPVVNEFLKFIPVSNG